MYQSGGRYTSLEIFPLSCEFHDVELGVTYEVFLQSLKGKNSIRIQTLAKGKHQHDSRRPVYFDTNSMFTGMIAGESTTTTFFL